MTAVPLEQDLHGDLGRLADAVQRLHERVTLTRDGEPVAVVVGVAELAALEETVDILRTPGEAAAIDEGLAELRQDLDVDGPAALAKYLSERPKR